VKKKKTTRHHAPAWPAEQRRLDRVDSLRREITSALNRASAENESDTPDFVLAEFLLDALKAFDRATQQRDSWYGYQYVRTQRAVRPVVRLKRRKVRRTN